MGPTSSWPETRDRVLALVADKRRRKARWGKEAARRAAVEVIGEYSHGLFENARGTALASSESYRMYIQPSMWPGFFRRLGITSNSVVAWLLDAEHALLRRNVAVGVYRDIN